MGYFVTGTDTGIGKTLFACALLHAFAARGLRAVGMKPVAAGVEPDGHCEDVERLIAAGNVAAERAWVNPYLLREPLAPNIAAQRDGVTIDLHHIARCFGRLREQADVVVVEGAGGFRVPLTDDQDGADLARLLGLPLILVVGLRLGCLNHALLTAEAIQSRGLALAGWIANQVDPHMTCVEANLETLRARLAAPCLGVVPHQAGPDATRIAEMLRLPDVG
ncbi:MAG: dethiobiotin synthase [Rhodocyclales bacterium]|nr:dethiobiotin synthase [Rhodocyclales bacterium]